MPARSIADALSDSPAGPLIAKLAQNQRIAQTLSQAVAKIAPDFDARDGGACELREGVLWLNARSSAQAAKLRQGIPGLLRLLHQQGAQVTEIRVRVQLARMTYAEQANAASSFGGAALPSGSARGEAPPDPAAAGPSPFGTPASVGAREMADELARVLPESPLRAAALRLQRALRRRSG